MLLKKLFVRAGLVCSTAMVAVSAHATSVLDAASKAAITSGFTDMKDTALDVLATTWPLLLGMMAVMFGPKIVKRLAHSL